MTAVDIFTAPRMKQIEDTTVVGGLVDVDGNLLLTTREGTEINAGYVKGPPGQDGIIGVDGAPGTPGDTAIPAGTVTLWVGETAPTNWLICEGQAVSRTAYPSLFNAIGIKYGAGDGVNTFNLPNLKGRTPVGLDTSQTEFNALAKVGGSKTHLLTAAQSGIRDHTHPFGWGTPNGDLLGLQGGGGGGWALLNDGANNNIYRPGGVGANLAANAQEAHPILQPYTVVNFIIKATAGTTPGDSELATRLSELESKFSGTPAGTITGWAGLVAPTNWLICDGSAISRTTYASLFSAIGTSYGVGDGSTTFNLPNLKGRVPVGRDLSQSEFDQLGDTGGTKTHAHRHVSPIGLSGGNAYVLNIANSQMDTTGSYDIGGIVSGSQHQGGGMGPAAGAMEHWIVTSTQEGTLQPFQVINYIIKFTNGDTRGDSQLTTRVSSLEARTEYNTKLRDRTALMQHLMTGGGTRKCNSAASVSWSQPFRTMGAGRDDLVPSGYFNIDMPPNGTVIPVIGHPTVTSVTVAGGMINFSTLSGYGALYYDLPYGSVATGQPGRFKLVDYSFAPVVIPPSWLLICQHNIDVGSADYRWGDGRNQDRWRPLTLQNTWVNYNAAGGTFSNAGWRYQDDGKILLRGLVAGGTAIISNIGAGLGPDQVEIFYGHANLGGVRVDASPNGDIGMSGYTGGANNAFVSLENISWYPSSV